MKSAALAFVLALGSLVGCAVPASSGGDTSSSDDDATMSEQSEALSMGGMTGATSRGKCRRCKNKCADDYPRGGGSLITCRKLCDLSDCKKAGAFSPGGSSI